MPGDEPYAGHNPAAVVLLILLGVVTTICLMSYGIRLLLLADRLKPAIAVTRIGAVLAWTATIGIYTWGILHLLFFDDSDRSKACSKVVGAQRLVGYKPSFVPLHFGCRTSNGHTIEAIIPSYVNPSVAIFALCAIVFTGSLFIMNKEDIN